VTFILGPVAPVDHKYPAPALEFKFTLPPAQNVVGPSAVIVGGAGNGFTITVVAMETELWHPLALVI
jgi:hypothetical protein